MARWLDSNVGFVVQSGFLYLPLLSAGDVTSALEGGLATLYHGYIPRLRNGCHSLDSLTQIRRSLDFMDYRIPSDHPDIVARKVEVTNART